MNATVAAPSGEAMPAGDLPGWHQVFADDFTTDVPLGSFPAAVSTKWGAYPSPWKDTSGYGTYSPTKVVSIAGGLLNEHIHTESGVSMVSALTPKLPSPMTYGRYAVRYRFDSTPGYKIAWMLWPDSGGGALNGEIDFPEMNLDATSVYAFMHHTNSTGSGDQDWARAPLTPGTWHTSVIEWSPNQVVFIFDGKEIGRSFERVASTPMHWVLQTETALTTHTAADPSVAGNVQIDWAAAWTRDTSTADTVSPTVGVTGPVDGTTVSGAQTLSATAVDDKAVVGLQFKVDGANVGPELTSGPYSAAWNTALTTNGTHTVSATARDLAGNRTTSTAVVTVANVQDTTPPTVVGTVPQANGTVFPVAANIYATFSEAVTGVSSSSFTLKNATTGAVVPATVTYSLTASQSQAKLDPSVNLADDTKYTLSLTSAIKDRSGNALAPLSWSFVTGPRPTAKATSPAAGATGVSRSTNVTATASEDLTRVGTTTALLTSSSGAKIAAAVSFNATTNVVTIDPTSALAANTKYTVSLTSGIKDLVGNPLTPLTWTFTTGA